MDPVKIYVAGHEGLIGRALVRELLGHGFVEEDVLFRTHAELDLSDQAAVRGFLAHEKPDHIYIAAAKVGGIYANEQDPADLMYQNLMIQTNLIDSARRAGVRRLLFIGATSMYPRWAPQPTCEEALLTGTLDPTHEPYAVAKIAGIKLCESYNRQYGTDFRSVLSANVYGPGANYDPQTSAVIPALIQRFYVAKQANKPSVSIPGSGKAEREFLYVDDLARAARFVMSIEKRDYLRETRPMRSFYNAGSGELISIADLAQLIAHVVGYEGALEFDTTQSNGPPVRYLDSSRLDKLGWCAHVFLKKGLPRTYADFLARLEAGSLQLPDSTLNPTSGSPLGLNA